MVYRSIPVIFGNFFRIRGIIAYFLFFPVLLTGLFAEESRAMPFEEATITIKEEPGVLPTPEVPVFLLKTEPDFIKPDSLPDLVYNFTEFDIPYESLPEPKIPEYISGILHYPERPDTLSDILPLPEIFYVPPVIVEEPERSDIPIIPEYIMGLGIVPENNLSGFLSFFNPHAGDLADELAVLYIEEAYIEGVNHDAAFAQMCLETGFLRFGGLVIPDMNNFCGLGAIGPGQEGIWFPDPRTGVRAHIQHLKVYATDEPLNRELVDPRNILVRSGSSPKISGLSGTWAEDTYYAEKIRSIMERMYEYSFTEKYSIAVIDVIDVLYDEFEAMADDAFIDDQFIIEYLDSGIFFNEMLIEFPYTESSPW